MTAPTEQGISHAEIFGRLERVKAAAAERGMTGLVAIARSSFERPANVAYLSNHFPPFPTGMFWGEIAGEEGVRIEEEIIVTDGEPEISHVSAPANGSRDAGNR